MHTTTTTPAAEKIKAFMSEFPTDVLETNIRLEERLKLSHEPDHPYLIALKHELSSRNSSPSSSI
jgi:hypothetical protein